MPTTAGVYTAGLTAGTEVSSTYEGRHITLLESELIHPKRDSGFVEKGDPICAFAPGTGGVSVGVAFNGGIATTLIALDTEGIWNLNVWSYDDDGGIAINHGDQLYIDFFNTGDTIVAGVGSCAISKISNTTTNIPFGVAWGALGASTSGVIAVKVHYDPKTTGSKGIDHVQGTTADPIEWGTIGANVKQVIFNVGILPDYISGLFIRAYAEEDVPAGGIQGLIYSRVTVQADCQDMYAIRGRVNLEMSTPSDTIANMVVGGMFHATLNNPGFNLTLADRIKGIDVGVSQTATSAIVGGSICGIYVSISGILVDNGGRTSGIYIYQGGVGAYPDYGIYIQMESVNTLAGIKIEQLAAAAGYGIDFEDSGGFGYDALMRYDGVNTQGYFLQVTPSAGAEDSAIILDAFTSAQTADFRLRVRLVGDAVDRYIYLYPV